MGKTLYGAPAVHYEKYRVLAEQERNVLFGGHLGTYKYYDMDQVVAEALRTAEQVITFLPLRNVSITSDESILTNLCQ